MNNSQKGLWAIVIIIVVVILAVLAVYAFTAPTQSSVPASGQTPASQNIQAVFTCDGGKTIDATFTNATTATTTGNSVMLALSDGRQMSLPQVISADGARYANADQSFVFWNVGDQATIWENSTTTFTNCVSQS